MDSPETLATLSNGQSRDTGNIEQWTVQRHLATLSNGQSRDTGNIEHTRYRTKTNKATRAQYRKLKSLKFA
jgi:hypothetical protein